MPPGQVVAVLILVLSSAVPTLNSFTQFGTPGNIKEGLDAFISVMALAGGTSNLQKTAPVDFLDLSKTFGNEVGPQSLVVAFGLFNQTWEESERTLAESDEILVLFRANVNEIPYILRSGCNHLLAHITALEEASISISVWRVAETRSLLESDRTVAMIEAARTHVFARNAVNYTSDGERKSAESKQGSERKKNKADASALKARLKANFFPVALAFIGTVLLLKSTGFNFTVAQVVLIIFLYLATASFAWMLFNGIAARHEDNAKEFAALSGKFESLLKIARQIKLEHLDKAYYFLEKLNRNVGGVDPAQDHQLQDHVSFAASAKSCQTMIKKYMQDADDGYVLAEKRQQLRKIIKQLEDME